MITEIGILFLVGLIIFLYYRLHKKLEFIEDRIADRVNALWLDMQKRKGNYPRKRITPRYDKSQFNIVQQSERNNHDSNKR